MTKKTTNEKTSRRAFLRSAGAGAAAFGFPAIVSRTSLAQSGGMKTLVLGDAPFISKGPCMIAFEKGFFRKLGLAIEYKWFMDGGLIISPMISGEVHLGSLTASAGVFNAIARGADVQMFLDGGTNLRRERAYGVTLVNQALWDDGIRTPEDLPKAADLPAHMSVKGSLNEFILDRTYLKGGVDPRKVQTNYGLPQPKAMQLMMKGGVNVTNLAYHFAWLLQSKKKAQPIALSYDVAEGSVISCYAFSKAKMAETGRESYVRFAMAYLEGVRLFNEAAATKPPPADIMKYLTTHTLFKGDRGRKMLTTIQPHWGWTKPDGKPHKAGLSMMQDHWVDLRGYVKQKVSIDGLVDHDIVGEAAQRLAEEKPFGTV